MDLNNCKLKIDSDEIEYMLTHGKQLLLSKEDESGIVVITMVN